MPLFVDYGCSLVFDGVCWRCLIRTRGAGREWRRPATSWKVERGSLPFGGISGHFVGFREILGYVEAGSFCLDLIDAAFLNNYST